VFIPLSVGRFGAKMKGAVSPPLSAKLCLSLGRARVSPAPHSLWHSRHTKAWVESWVRDSPGEGLHHGDLKTLPDRARDRAREPPLVWGMKLLPTGTPPGHVRDSSELCPPQGLPATTQGCPSVLWKALSHRDKQRLLRSARFSSPSLQALGRHPPLILRQLAIRDGALSPKAAQLEVEFTPRIRALPFAREPPSRLPMPNSQPSWERDPGPPCDRGGARRRAERRSGQAHRPIRHCPHCRFGKGVPGMKEHTVLILPG
jgi:hypothetical protein